MLGEIVGGERIELSSVESKSTVLAVELTTSSRGRIRTCDREVNSFVLYRLATREYTTILDLLSHRQELNLQLSHYKRGTLPIASRRQNRYEHGSGSQLEFKLAL